MFKKVLASIGIGSAKVDTLVLQETVQPGGTLQISVEIQGGDVAQEITGLDLALMTRVKKEIDDAVTYTNQCLQSWKIEGGFELQPGERRSIPMSLQIHDETPLTALECPYQQSQVWLQTGLDIDLAIDPTDKDILWVAPTVAMERFLIAMQRCGLQLIKSDVEVGQLNGGNFTSTTGCYQELEYKPTSMLTTLQEVEVSFVKQGDVTHALIEVDRHFRGDAYVSMSWNDGATIDAVEADLRQRLHIA